MKMLKQNKTVVLCIGDILGVVSMSRDVVDESFIGLCDEMTSSGWQVSRLLLAADEWRVQWTNHHQQQQQHEQHADYKKLY